MANNRIGVKFKSWLDKVRLNTEQRRLQRRLVALQKRIKKYKNFKQDLQIKAVIVDGWIRTDQEDLDDLTQKLVDLLMKNIPVNPAEYKKKKRKVKE